MLRKNYLRFMIKEEWKSVIDKYKSNNLDNKYLVSVDLVISNMDWKNYSYKDLINDIVQEFSSRFCIIDVQTAIKRINGELPSEHPLLFLYIVPEVRPYMHYLKEWEYHNMLAIFMQTCSLSSRLRDLCSPIVTDEEFDRLEQYFKDVQGEGFKYLWCDEGLAMDVPEPFTDIVMCPLSQLHNEIVNALKMFGQFVDAGFKDNVYQDFYSPSLFTQFSQKWVADKFGIVKTFDNIGV